MFVSGCLSDELYATSSELVHHAPMTECSVLESEKSADMEIKDLTCNMNNSTSEETCSCSTEDNTQLSDFGTREETENSNLNLSSDSKSETVQDLDESVLHKSSIKTYEQQGARPKVVDRSKNRQGTSNVHLSNKKRKELAKQEKKKRREERRKEDSSPCVDSGAAGEQNTSNAIVADLGLLAI